MHYYINYQLDLDINHIIIIKLKNQYFHLMQSNVMNFSLLYQLIINYHQKKYINSKKQYYLKLKLK